MLLKASPVCFATLCVLFAVNPVFSQEHGSAEQHFTTVDFPGASGTSAFGINARGDIVGDYNQDQHGFLLSKGEFITIDFPGGSATAARGINSQGDIVGLYCLQGPVPSLCNGTGLHGFLLTNGEFRTVDFPGASSTAAYGINAEGQIVGDYASSVGPCAAVPGEGCHGFLLSKGEFTTINVPGALGTTARGISRDGSIVGFYVSATGFHGFLFSNGAYITIDANVPGSSLTTVFGINFKGSIVGSTGNHGFLLRRGTFTFVDFPAADVTTIPLGINPEGNIVGFYFTGNFINLHGFLLRVER